VDDDDDEESKDDLLSSSRNESIPRCFFPGGLFEMSAGYIMQSSQFAIPSTGT
jgi:hypothetical protein